MAKDPVCGMDIEEQKPRGHSQHNGRSYFSVRRAARKSLTRIPSDTRNNADFLSVNSEAVE